LTLHSLRFRLLGATLVVVLVTVSVMAVFASQRTAGEFRSYVAHDDRLRQRRFAFALTRAYAQTQTWQNIQPIIEQWGQVSGDQVVVADLQGNIVGDSSKDLLGKTVGPRWPPPSGPIIFDGAQVGSFYINPLSQPSLVNVDFLAAVNRSVLLGALIAGTVAVVIALIVSHRIVQPVESLTTAARHMEKGDLATRVNVTSNDEIGQLAHAFNAMADGLARQEQLRRNMVSDVAHELRAPLTNIRGYLEAAKDGLVQPDGALVDNLYEEAILLSRLVKDLQDLALAEAGQLRLERCPVEVSDVVLATVEVLGPHAEARDISLVVQLPDDLPRVEADPHRMRQVLRNLLNNALDFTPQGGQVTVTARPDGAWVDFQVRDTGPGIAPEHLPYVFERFYRVDPPRTRARAEGSVRAGGAGLGLAIVKQLVEAHGGRVWVESTVGTGATFGFTLPLASM
jgi:signal transduction histidine kinase